MSSVEEQLEELEELKAETAANEELSPGERKKALAKIRRRIRSLKKAAGTYEPRKRSSTPRQARSTKRRNTPSSIARFGTRKEEVTFYKKLSHYLQKSGLEKRTPPTAPKFGEDKSKAPMLYCFSGLLIIDYHLKKNLPVEQVAQDIIDKFKLAWDDNQPTWFTILNKSSNPLFALGPVPRGLTPNEPTI